MKRFIYNTIGVFGGYYISRKITRNHTRILMYHRFGGENENRKIYSKLFDREVAHLVKNYEVISLSELVSNFKDNIRKTKPEVVITVDDGYEDFYHYAYPILKKYNASATVFLTTDFIEGKCWLWPDIIEYMLLKTGLKIFDYHNGDIKFFLPLNNMMERRLAWSEICNYCLMIENSQKLEFINVLKNLLRVDLDETPNKEYAPLTWNEIMAMMKNKIEFGSHTATHPILTKITIEDLEYEIAGSKKILEDRLHEEITSFCYPQGRFIDYNDVIKDKVKKAGYQCAVTTNEGLNSGVDDAYELKRISGGNKEFKKNIYGASHILNKFRFLT